MRPRGSGGSIAVEEVAGEWGIGGKSNLKTDYRYCFSCHTVVVEIVGFGPIYRTDDMEENKLFESLDAV